MADVTERLSETTRIEAFSDAVFAISITLLALDLVTPAPGEFAHGLLDDWSSYLSYLVAFLTIATIWMHHHSVFTRVGKVGSSVAILNLVVLLGTSLLPWPARLIGSSLRDGNLSDQTAAILLYGIVSLIFASGWISLSALLARHPELLERASDVRFMKLTTVQSAFSVIPTFVAIGLAFVAPMASLVVYLAVPVSFLILIARNREVAAD